MLGIPKMHLCLGPCLLLQASWDSESWQGKHARPLPSTEEMGLLSLPQWESPLHTPKVVCVPSRQLQGRMLTPHPPSCSFQ